MRKDFFVDKAFIRHINDWVGNAEQRSAMWLKNFRNTIPPAFRQVNETLYRGQFVPDTTLERFTSWSKSKEQALKFLSDPAFKFNVSNSKEQYIITKKLNPNDIILDIDKFVNFFGSNTLVSLGYDDLVVDSMLKEKEVLVNNNIILAKNDIRKI